MSRPAARAAAVFTERPLPTGRGRRVETLAIFLLGAAYAAWASGVAPFSARSDAAVAAPSAIFVTAMVLQRRWPAGPWRRLTALRPAAGGSSALWLAVIALLVAVELASYFHGGPRARYPTVSSAENALSHLRAARATIWLVWLAMGWYLARR